MADLLGALREGVLGTMPKIAWPTARIFVPHSGAASAVRAALKVEGAGLLPEIINLESPDAFALNLGLTLPPAANSWPLRGRALMALKRALPEVGEEALIPRTEEVLQSLNLLAEYNISVNQLRESVPDNLREVWAEQGHVLQELWAFAAPQAAALLPAGRKRVVWEKVAEALQKNPSASPQLWVGEVPESPALKNLYEVLQTQSLQSLDLGLEASALYTLVADNPLQEMQRLALWIAGQVEVKNTPVHVVAGGVFARRLVLELEIRFGIKPDTTGGLRWKETDIGKALLARAERWRVSEKPLTMPYWLVGFLRDETLPPTLVALLEMLALLPDYWSGPLAYAWLEQALTALAPQEERVGDYDGRVRLLPPHAACFQPCAILVVPEMIEGVWPTAGQTGALSQGQRRVLGLPERESQAKTTAHILRQLQTQGAGQVVMSRAEKDESGNILLASRWWPQGAAKLTEPHAISQLVKARGSETLGAFYPAARQKVSPSFIEALLACPYKAYAQRVLNLDSLPAILPEPDKRAMGTLVHAWAEAGAKRYPHITAENAEEAVTFLHQHAATLLAQEGALMQVLLENRLHRLAAGLVQEWQTQNRTLKVEEALAFITAEGITLRATADAISTDGVVLDYKTATPPSKADVLKGTKPQLALEAWLLQQNNRPVQGAEYWHLKGYSKEPVVISPMPVNDIIKPVEGSLKALQEIYLTEGKEWPAVPDADGGGLLEKGACASCALAGLCRRKAVAMEGAAA